MKFLIDEDLSPKVAERPCVDDGLDVIHVRDRGLLGEPDSVILQKVYDEDRILVTANVRDFQPAIPNQKWNTNHYEIHSS